MFFIANPTAGNGRVARLWPELMDQAQRLGLRYECETTRGPLTATSFVRQALRAGAETIVAVGGDGTVSEAVNGFFLDDVPLSPGAALGIVPMGSSSDLARGLGIPGGPASLDVIAHGRAIAVDLGRASFRDAEGRPTVRYFANNADVGIGARIAARVGRWTWAGGQAAFLLSSLAGLVDPRPWEGTLAIDGADPSPVRAITVVVALGPYTGGGMHVAPAAKIDDGLFDVVTIDAMDRTELLANLPRLYAGTHLTHPGVHHARATEVRVESADAPPIELDGEVSGAGSVEFRILPRGIKIYVGKP